MLDTFALVALERALSRVLARDPATPSRLAALAGRTLRVTLESPEIMVRVAFHDTGLTLARIRDWDSEDDVTVTLTPAALERLAAGDSLERLLFSGTLPVSGQTALLGNVQTLFMNVDLDWESALAHGLGRGTAHGIATAVQRLTRHARYLGGEWQHDLREYVFEEGRWLAGRDQLETARDQIGEVRQRLDRLEARVGIIHRDRAREPRS